MKQFYEVLRIVEFVDDTVEDVDSIGEVEFDIDDEDSIIDALEEFSLNIPTNWDINADSDMGIVDIYNENGEYVYQLRSNE